MIQEHLLYTATHLEFVLLLSERVRPTYNRFDNWGCIAQLIFAYFFFSVSLCNFILMRLVAYKRYSSWLGVVSLVGDGICCFLYSFKKWLWKLNLSKSVLSPNNIRSCSSGRTKEVEVSLHLSDVTVQVLFLRRSSLPSQPYTLSFALSRSDVRQLWSER